MATGTINERSVDGVVNLIPDTLAARSENRT